MSEPTTLENPVIKDDLEPFLEAAAAADRGLDFKMPSANESEPRTPDTTEAEQTSNTDTTPEKVTDERPRDELGRFTKTVEGADIPEAERTPAEAGDVGKTDGKPGDTTDSAKPDSPYERARKDQERLNRNRQEFEAEKARERETIAQERQRLAAERQELEQQRQPQQRNGDKPITAEQYSAFIRKCREKATEAREIGEDDEADEHLDLALRAMPKMEEAYKREQTEFYQTELRAATDAWNRDMFERIRQEPALNERDANGQFSSPIAKETFNVMGAYPGVFEAIPPVRLPDGRIMGGFSFAAEVAKLRLKAGATSVLEQTVKQQKAEIDRLNGLTSMSDGGPTPSITPRSVESMTPEQQDEYFITQARRADAANQ